MTATYHTPAAGTYAAAPMQLDDSNLVIAVVSGDIDRPCVYGIPRSEADAERMIADIARSGYYRDPRVLTYGEYAAEESARWSAICAASLKVTTAEQFDYALNVLPPRNWIHDHGIEMFTMSEHDSGPYTTQYARVGTGDAAIYLSKLVNAYDRKTWITKADAATAPEEQPAKQPAKPPTRPALPPPLLTHWQMDGDPFVLDAVGSDDDGEYVHLRTSGRALTLSLDSFWQMVDRGKITQYDA